MIKNKLIRSLSALMVSAMVLTSGVPVNVLADVNTDKDHVHTYDEIWHTNPSAHWHNFTCGCFTKYDLTTNPTYALHDWDMDNATVVAPTDSSRGYTIAKCKACGYSEKINYTSHLGEHKWVKFYTANENGEKYDYYKCSIDGCYEIKKENKSIPLKNVLTYEPTSGDYNFGVNLYIDITENLSDYGWDAVCYNVQEDENTIYSGYLTNEEGNNSFQKTLGVESESHVYKLTIYPVIKNGENYIPVEDVADKTITESYNTSLKENHTWEVKHDDNGHWKEAVCHPSVIKDYENHTFEVDNDTYKEATCYQDGYAKYTCGFCGYEKEVITPKVDHDFSERESINGHEVAVCYYCGKKKCLGKHDANWVVTKEPTDTEDGVREKVCNICGEVLDTQTFKKDEDIELETPLVKIHNGNLTKTFGHFIFKLNTTVNNNATIIYSSSNPNVATVDENGIVTIQGVGTTVLTAKVNAISGWKEGSDSITLTVESDKLNHKHNFATDWSCDSTYHWHKCLTDNCDGSIADKGEHKVSDWIIDSNPTTTKTGSRHKECTVCGYIIKTEEIPVVKPTHTHHWTNEWTSDENYHWHKCTESNCDGTVKDKTEHIPSDWIIDKPATEFSSGKRHIECTVCGHIMHTAIDLPIIPIHTIDSKWSSDNNYHWHKCLDSGCNYISDKEEHKPIYVTESKVGTYTDGVVIKKCSVCGREIAKYTSYGFFTKSHYEKLKDKIKEYEEKGETLYLNHGSLNKNDYIPKEFLEMIKGHDVEVELSINTDAISSEILENSINIRFNGKDVKNPQDIYPGSKLTKAINFDDAKEKVEETLKTIVTKDNALDYALLLSAIKPSKLMYFSINNTTDFDFPIEYQLRYFYQDTDKYISLFHINNDGKLEFVKEIKNDADTGSWFTLTKTGSYVALASTTPIKDAKIDTNPTTPDKPSTPNTPINPNPSTNNTPTLDNTVNNNNNTNNETITKTSTDENNNVSEIKKSVKTNDSNNIWYSIIISLLGFGAIFLASKKKHSINK